MVVVPEVLAFCGSTLAPPSLAVVEVEVEVEEVLGIELDCVTGAVFEVLVPWALTPAPPPLAVEETEGVTEELNAGLETCDEDGSVVVVTIELIAGNEDEELVKFEKLNEADKRLLAPLVYLPSPSIPLPPVGSTVLDDDDAMAINVEVGDGREIVEIGANGILELIAIADGLDARVRVGKKLEFSDGEEEL